MFNIFCPRSLLHYKVTRGLATDDEAFEWFNMNKRFENRLRIIKRNGSKEDLQNLYKEMFGCY